MSIKENEPSVHDSELITRLRDLRNVVEVELSTEALKKGKRKRLKRTLKMINKIDEKVESCTEKTGDCDGLILTIAKGDSESKKIKCAKYIVDNLVTSQQPSHSYGKSESRYTIKCYPTYDKNIFVEDTKHQPKIQEPRRIRLVGINVVNLRKSSKKKHLKSS